MGRRVWHAVGHEAGSTLTRRIRRRLRLGLLISTIVAAGAVMIGAWAFLEIDRSHREILTGLSSVQQHVTNLNDAILEEVLHTRAYLITGDEESAARRDLAHKNTEQEYAQLQGMLARLSDEPARELQELMNVHADDDTLAAELVGLRRSGQAEAAVKQFDERSDQLVSRQLLVQHDLQRDVQAALVEVNDDYSVRTSQIVILAALVFLAGIVASSWLVTRLLASPLQSLDYIERALIETGQPGTLHPIRLPASVTAHHGPMFEAYNSLADRLEDGEALSSRFVSSVAHALRTQLAAILGYASLLADPAWQTTADADAQYARIIVQQAQQMGKMVEDMVTVALIDEDRLEISLAPLRIQPLAKAVIEEARQHSGRAICFEDNSDTVLVLGDVLCLREVLSRLIDNALKFSAPDTPVHVTLQSSSTSGWLEMAVGDQGIGIADADLPLLFLRFGRIRNKQTQGIPGNGLGLYIVKHYVQAHHGRIEVRSRPDQGTTFLVSLPLAEPAAQRPEEEPHD